MSAAMGSGDLSPEIARLAAQLAKDPKSKLFIPLAEEYMKEGLAEEAIMTLEDGLKNHPGYMSARVMLGKAFLQKGDVEGSRGQFEAVIKAVPDNLFAHKKLGEIYIHLGMREEAQKSFNILSMLNPSDEEARSTLKTLESGIMPESTLVLPVKEEEKEKAAEAEPAEPEEAQAPPAKEPPQEMDPFADEKTRPAFTMPDEPGEDVAEDAGTDFLMESDEPVGEAEVEAEGFPGEDSTSPAFEIEPPAGTGVMDAEEPEEVSESSGPGFEIDMEVPPASDAQAQMQAILSEYEEGGPSEVSGDDALGGVSYELPDEVSAPEMGGLVMEGAEAESAPADDVFGTVEHQPGTGEDIFGSAEPADTGEDIFASAAPAPEAEAGGEDIFGSAEPADTGEDIFASAAPAPEAESGGEDIFGSAEPADTGEDIFASAAPAPEVEAGGEDIFGGAEPVDTGEDIFASAAPPEPEEDIFAAAEPSEPFEDAFSAEPVPEAASAGEDIFAAAGHLEPDEDIEVEAVHEDRDAGDEGKEPFSTASLADMYIQQGFYDRAINIYKEMLAESPSDNELKQKLEDLYVLAGMDSTVKAEEAEGAMSAQAYEPVDFDSIPDDSGTREFSVAQTGVAVTAPPQAEVPAGGEGVALARLEKFLDNIRKRSRR